MKKKKQRLILIALASALLLIVLVGCGVGFLLSPAGSSFVLRQIKSQLAAKLHADLQFSEGRLNLLNGLYFKDLHVVAHHEGLDADIKIHELQLDYAFSWFGRWVKIERLKLAQPQIQLQLANVQPQLQAAQSDTASSKSWLYAPPTSLSAHNIIVENLDLDFKQSGRQETHLQVRDMNSHLDLDLLPGRLSATGDVDLGHQGYVEQITRTQELERNLSLNFGGKAKWSVGLTQDASGHLKLDLNPSDASFTLANITISQTQDGVSQKLNVNKGEVNLHSALNAKLAATVVANLSQVVLPGHLARPADIQWKMDLEAARDLSEFHLTSDFDLAGIKLLELNGTGHQSPHATDFNGHLLLLSRPELRRLLPKLAWLKQNPQLRATIDFTVEVDPDQNIKFNSNASVPQMRLPGSTALTTAQITEHATWQNAKRHLDLDCEAQVKHQDFGSWQIKTKLQFEQLSGHDKNQSAGFQTAGVNSISLLAPGRKPLPAELVGDIELKHQVTLEPGGRIEAQIDVRIPQVNVKNVALLSDTEMKITAHSTDTNGKSVDLNVNVNQGQIILAQRSGVRLQPLSGLNLEVKGTLKDHQAISFPQIALNVDRGLVALTAEAAGNLNTKDFQLRGSAQLQVPANFPELNGVQVYGSLQLPVTLAIYRGKELTLETDLAFTNFSVHKNDLMVDQLNGHVPISEKLVWDGHHVRFAELISENPFERVDFNRVRPLLSSNEQLKVDHVQWREKTYGPFVGFFSIRQNMVSAHQFDMDLNGGRANGELFFNIYPANLQLGFLGRLTSLNLTEFLPREFLKGQDTKARDLSARLGMVCNLNRATINGRMDVTEVGGRQLAALINVLDPAYRDEKMNKIRSLLQVGYPTGVNMAFAEGFMDMDINLTVLSFTTRESVHGIPVTAFISKAMNSLVQQTNKGVLQ